MEYTKISQIIDALNRSFSPEAAGDLDAVLQYHISGEDKDCGDWMIIIKDGTCKIEKGVHESPTVDISMADQIWLGLFNHTVSPLLAFTKRKVKVKGRFKLAGDVPKLFPVP